MTFGSLFAGIGGFDLGFERAGMRCLWQVENNEFCRKVLARHFPHAVLYSDIKQVVGEELATVDVICGGFPCQDISVANKNASGLSGERSGLWFEMLRIIESKRPAWVVAENVPRIYQMGIDVCLSNLEALGYATTTLGLPACAVGAWHKRDRCFIVGSHSDGLGMLTSGGAPEPQQGVYRNGRRRSPLAQQEGRDTFHRIGSDVVSVRSATVCEESDEREPSAQGESVRLATNFGEQSRLFESKLCGDIHGIPDGLDRLRSLGNAVVPQIAEWIGKQLMANTPQNIGLPSTPNPVATEESESPSGVQSQKEIP